MTLQHGVGKGKGKERTGRKGVKAGIIYNGGNERKAMRSRVRSKHACVLHDVNAIVTAKKVFLDSQAQISSWI